MRSFFFRCLSCLCLVTAWYFDVWWLGIPLMGWHTYHYTGYECVFFAVCIDVQFMAGLSIPWYTISAAVAVVSMELIKPMLRRHTTLTL